MTNLKKALQYYHRSLEVKSSLDKYPRTGTLANISLCYSELKDFSKAIEYSRKSFDSCQPECQDFFMVERLQTCGAFHFHKGNYDSAEVYYLKSYSLAKKMDSKRYQLILVNNLTDIYFRRNQITLALQYLSDSEWIMKQTPFGYELIELYARFSTLCKRTGDVKKRTFYQERYIQMKSSIYDETLANNLMDIESDYLERGNKARIVEQEQLLMLQDQVIKRKGSLNILISIVTLLLTALFYILYRNNRRRKYANRLLDLKVRERTAALESNHIALKQSIEMEDNAIDNMFTDIKRATGDIRELCFLGLALEERHMEERKKYLQEIWTVTGHFSVALSSIQGAGNRNENET